MKCFRILILFFIQAYFSTLNAQSVKDFNTVNFTNGNGLPQNSIKAIELDKDGYMWMGTESGLVRFDGKNFRIFNRNNLRTLSSDRISHVGLMSDSTIFFIDEHSVIYYKNPAGGFVRAKQKANDELIQKVSDGLYSPAGNLAIAGYNYIKSRYIDQWTNNIILYPTTDSLTGFISVNKRTIAYVARKQVLWMHDISSCNRHVLRSTGILKNQLYFLDEDYELTAIDSSGRQQKIQITGLPPNPLKGKALAADFSLLQQRDQLYLLYQGKIYQLHYTDTHRLSATLIIDTEDIENISCFRYFPALHLYAIGTNTQGLFLLRPKPFHTLRLPETDNIFYAQVPYNDSAVLSHYGVFGTNSFSPLPLGKVHKLAILKDKRGGYWLNKAAESIIYTDEQLHVRRKIKMDDIYVNSFAQGPDNRVWLITNKNRIGRINDSSISWINLNMSANSLVTLLPDGNEHFWIGGNRQLFTINTRTGSILHYTYFNECDVRSLYMDRHSVLWIGTYGKGFYALSRKKLISLPTDSKGNLNYVHSILEDRRGNVWITTNNGLFRTRKSDLESFIANEKGPAPIYYQHYTKEQGFNTNEFNGGCNPAAVELANGKISLPSMNGLVQFYPDSLQDVFPTAKIFIDELLLDGKPVKLYEQMELPPHFNRLDITVSSPYYGNPGNQLIEYSLEGFDDKWYPLTANNTITYNRLPYGNYTLLLRKKAGFGPLNYINTRITFQVIPFFYQQWYFKLFLLLLCIGLVLFFFRIRYFFLINKQHKLEQKVQQRTRELVYNNRLKEKLTLLIAHDLQSPLHFLSILARHVYKAAQNNDTKSILEGSEEIRNTTAKIYSFVEEFNLWNMSMNESYRLKKTSFRVRPLIEELHQFFEEMLRLKNNRMEILYFHELSIATDRDVLKAILRNIIDNANKYTHNGEISIKITRDEDNCLMISISDTGEGMHELELEKIQNRIKQAASIPGIEKDGRLGFQLIIDFAARLEAKLSITSVKHTGTTVTIAGFACEN